MITAAESYVVGFYPDQTLKRLESGDLSLFIIQDFRTVNRQKSLS